LKNILNNLYYKLENLDFENKENILNSILEAIREENPTNDKKLIKKIKSILEEKREDKSIEYKQIINFEENKLKGVSLFANVGIAETYSDKYVDFFVANELLENRAKFYKEMNPQTNMINGSITDNDIFDEIIYQSLSFNCDFLMATPPCFTADTKIYTIYGYKNINTLKKGELVLTHKNRFQKIINLGSKDNQEIFEIYVNGIDTIKTTYNHPFYIKENFDDNPEWKEVKDISIGEYLAIPKMLSSNNIEDDYQWIKIKDILKTEKKERVYNIEVEEDNTYTANNAVVHNCQGISQAGKMKEDDPRNKLIIKVVEAIHAIKPKYFLIENVQRMPDTYIIVNNEKIKIRDFLKNELSDEYNINIDILNAKDFGTPQNRKRSFVIGSIKNEKEWKFPTKKQAEITVREAIGHLPSLEAGDISLVPYHYAKAHNKRHKLWMTHTPTGKTSFLNKVHYPKKENGERIKGFATTYKRIEWDKPAPTITMANGSISSQNNVHPGRKKDDGTYSDARVLTLKEIFILTGLPDNWSPPEFASENMIRQVIGEGVPPKLIEAILKTIFD